MTKQQLLDVVNKEIISCKICPVGKSGKPVVGAGNANADVVFIGEAPGKQEAVTGQPFIGRSGKILRELIRGIGLKEEVVYITSPVKYLPNGKDGTPGGPPNSSDIAHGRIHLMKQLSIIKPSFVILLGRVAAEGVLEKKVAVATEHGQVIEEKNLPAGKQDAIKYFLTVHPAAALRFPNKYKLVIKDDFKRLQKLLTKDHLH